MNKLLTMQLIYRRILTSRTINKQCLHSSSRLMNKNDSSSDSSSSDSDSDDNKNKKMIKKQPSENVKTTKNETQILLNDLIARMTERTVESQTYRAIPKKIKTPKPLKKPTLEESIITAAKQTADLLGGDKEETRKALIDKVFSAGKPEAKTAKQPEKNTETDPSKTSLSELLTGMKIERTPVNPVESTSMYSRTAKMQELRKRFQERDFQGKSYYGIPTKKVDLFSGIPLGIFNKNDKFIEREDMETWNALYERDLKLLLEHPPENIYQEMIQWTEKGLLWKFPINNEIGMEEEENVHFSEHVFMERHIQDWCPKRGPIRHFMELVCVGLSKNPYMKVQEKKDHLMWYKEFFGDRQELLKEIGAIEHDIIPQDGKQIEA